MKHFRLLAIVLVAATLAFTACDDNGGSDGGDGTTGATVINIAAIPGVTPPDHGETPVTAITETAQYTGTVSWSPVNDPFETETVYTATITLTAKTGYSLTGVEEDFFTVAGATSVANPADSGVVTAVFPATGSVPPTKIDIAAIAGVTVPVVGATPVAAITETAQYTGTVSWSQSDVTFGHKVYTATITLTAKSGYTLTGVAANFFTVAGTSAAATNPADSGVVTAIFPQADWATTYNLRDTGPAGGLIFYINPNAATDGWKYLECAPLSTEWTSNQWGKYGTLLGETGTAIGTGNNNTALIVAKLNEAPAESNRAAQLADALTYGGYSDWFLPSKDELYEICWVLNSRRWNEGAAEDNPAYGTNRVGGFTDGYYWSSSENFANYAWLQYFYNGHQYDFSKYITYRVRAVRAF